MNSSSKSERQQKIDDIRAETMDKVAVKAEKGFRDTRFNWLRTQPRRRMLVITCFVILGIYGYSTLTDRSGISLISLVAYFACMWLLRIAVRHMANLPPEVIDERMLQVRNNSYRLAYMGLTVFLIIGLFTYVFNKSLSAIFGIPLFTTEQVSNLFWVVFFASLILPGSMIAWTEREV